MVEPWTTAALVLALILYAAGVASVWRVAGRCRGATPGMLAAFAGGWLGLLASQLPAVTLLSGRLLSVHVLQHELLMVVAAPLLVLGRTAEIASWSVLYGGWRRWRRKRAQPLVDRASTAWAALSNPPAAWAALAICVWSWHVPAAFESALADPAVHLLQHGSLLLTALLFWSACLRPPQSSLNAGLVVLALFTTTLHTGALAALLAFSTAPWYPAYVVDVPPATALADQRLAGLVLAAAGALPYTAVAIALMGQRVARKDRRSVREGGDRAAG